LAISQEHAHFRLFNLLCLFFFSCFSASLSTVLLGFGSFLLILLQVPRTFPLGNKKARIEEMLKPPKAQATGGETASSMFDSTRWFGVA
jgi:hypothetical protein